MLTSASTWGTDAPVRVLIFSGQNNHDWRQTTPKLKSILTASGRFAVDVTDHPEQCDAATLARYDVVLGNWNTFGSPAVTNWPAATREAFLSFVRGGKGFVVVHAGSSSFYDWPEYQQLAGASWNLGQTSHGSPHQFTVLPVGDHPVTAGLQPFKTTDELWIKPGVDPRARVIATGDGQPLVLTTEFGRGRGFTLLLGHSAEFMNTPGFQTLLLRGTEWAATGKVTLPPDAGPRAAEDETLSALATYHFGDSRQPVLRLEELVASVTGNPAQARALAKKLAGLLSGNFTVEAKRVLCWQLSLIGSADEVPALAKCLGNPDLDYYARLALERMPLPAAESALLAALKTSSGQERLNLANSLAVRRSRQAVPAIASLLDDPDLAAKGMALDALARIGGDQAMRVLTTALLKLPPEMKTHGSAALLRCADGLAASGNTRQAAVILEKLTAPDEAPFIRMAAFVARVQASGDQGATLVTSALAGNDPVLQAAACRALRVAGNARLVPRVAECLGQLPARLQVQVIVWLGELGDPSAIPALSNAAASSTPEVKQAALSALGRAGNASVVPLLATTAAQGTDEDKRLVAESLARLRGAEVDSAMIELLAKAPAAQQRELIRGLVLRNTAAAVPALLELAGNKDSEVRADAVMAVGRLGNPSACDGLLKALAIDPDGAAAAMSEICRREGTVAPILAGLQKAQGEGKAALLGALASLGGAEALGAVRAEVKSDDPIMRAAAVRALASWPDASPLDDLAALAATTQDPKIKATALRGIAHLAPTAKDRSPDKAVEVIAQALKAGGGLNEQRALLAALAEVPGDAAATTAEAYVADPAVSNEAKAALEQIKARRAKEPPPAWDEQVAKLFQSPENLCRGAVATNLDGLVPDGAGQGALAAIDGDPATYWDETDNQKLYWLRITLKQKATVACLRILGFNHQDYAPRDFEVVCDGKTVKKVENAQYDRNLLTLDLPPTECRIVELKITGYYSQSPAIRELGLFSKASK